MNREEISVGLQGSDNHLGALKQECSLVFRMLSDKQKCWSKVYDEPLPDLYIIILFLVLVQLVKFKELHFKQENV